jgi:hypothetical protein
VTTRDRTRSCQIPPLYAETAAEYLNVQSHGLLSVGPQDYVPRICDELPPKQPVNINGPETFDLHDKTEILRNDHVADRGMFSILCHQQIHLAGTLTHLLYRGMSNLVRPLNRVPLVWVGNPAPVMGFMGPELRIGFASELAEGGDGAPHTSGATDGRRRRFWYYRLQ